MKHLFRLTPAGLSSALIGPGCDKKQMDRLEEDYKNERISRSESETRNSRIESGSVFY